MKIFPQEGFVYRSQGSHSNPISEDYGWRAAAGGYNQWFLGSDDGVITALVDGKSYNPNSNSDLGNYYTLKMDDGSQIRCGHCQKGSFQVKLGDRVKKYQRICQMGNSGYCIGGAYHTHMTYWDSTGKVVLPSQSGMVAYSGAVIYEGQLDMFRKEGAITIPTVPTSLYKALDISRYQSSFNAATAKSQGISDVIIRVAIEEDMDSKAAEFAQATLNAGLRLHGYGFARWHFQKTLETARAKMVSETNAWIKHCKALGVTEWFAIDIETESGYSISLSTTQLTDLIIEQADLLSKAGLNVCIYSMLAFLRNSIDVDRTKLPIWLAWYWWINPMDYNGTAEGLTNNGSLPDTGTANSNWVQARKDRIIGWQFDSRSWGSKYGVGSDGLDKNWLYRLPNADEPTRVGKPVERDIYNNQIEIVGDVEARSNPNLGSTIFGYFNKGFYRVTDTIDMTHEASNGFVWYAGGGYWGALTANMRYLPKQDKPAVETPTTPTEPSQYDKLIQVLVDIRDMINKVL